MKQEFSKIRSSLIAHRSSLIAAIKPRKPRPCRGKRYFSAAFLRPFLALLFPALLLGCEPIGELGDYVQKLQEGEKKLAGALLTALGLNPEEWSNDPVSAFKKLLGQSGAKAPSAGTEEVPAGLFGGTGEATVSQMLETLEKEAVTLSDGRKVRIVGFSGMGRVHPTTKEQSPIKGIIIVNEDVTRIIGLSITEQNETPDIGSRITEPKFQKQFHGKSIGTEIQFDAISGATRTSEAFTKIINAAIKELRVHLEDPNRKVFPEWLRGNWYEVDENGNPEGSVATIFTETKYMPFGGGMSWDLNKPKEVWALYFTVTEEGVWMFQSQDKRDKDKKEEADISYVKISNDKVEYSYSRTESRIRAKKAGSGRVFPEWIEGNWYEKTEVGEWTWKVMFAGTIMDTEEEGKVGLDEAPFTVSNSEVLYRKGSASYKYIKKSDSSLLDLAITQDGRTTTKTLRSQEEKDAAARIPPAEKSPDWIQGWWYRKPLDDSKPLFASDDLLLGFGEDTHAWGLFPLLPAKPEQKTYGLNEPGISFMDLGDRLIVRADSSGGPNIIYQKEDGNAFKTLRFHYASEEKGVPEKYKLLGGSIPLIRLGFPDWIQGDWYGTDPNGAPTTLLAKFTGTGYVIRPPVPKGSSLVSDRAAFKIFDGEVRYLMGNAYVFKYLKEPDGSINFVLIQKGNGQTPDQTKSQKLVKK